VPALGSAEVAITGAVAISGDSEIYASVALIVSGQNASMAIYDPTNVGNSVLVRFR
jgi:hypothetical protein